jgi:NADH-quinone oxidoreductase subunit C
VKLNSLQNNSEEQKSIRVIALLEEKLRGEILKSSIELATAVVEIEPARISEFFGLLKLDSQLAFNYLVDITAVDWLDAREKRFEMVYHLLSLSHLHRLRVKISLPEENPEIDSLVPLWKAANYLEREVWDMFGIRFKGHPDPRRILMYDEFKGHPLRKDYPVQGKQPRIPLRSPEVRNTALDMIRQPLVSINPKNKKGLRHGPGDVRKL